mmetsp:Transcript_17623/g.28504  ORF Transcript_17623/g.28504 Transcript_17623/m.28504 type:complete len:388 (-) Transcript_17623:677-1840(-)
MVFGRLSPTRKEEPVSPLSSFSLPTKDEEPMNISLDLASTISTDTDSSLSACADEGQARITSDLESPFGTLRHRTGDVVTHPQNEEKSIDDSDSEHGLVPRRRRKTNVYLKKYMFYALAMFVGLSSLLSMKSNVVSTSETAQWRDFRNYQVPIVRKAFKNYQPENQYTIILRGSRLDLLQQSLDIVSRCPSVNEVLVDYPNGELPIAMMSHDSRKVTPYSESLSTNAVFLLSEGVILSCTELEKGFQTWKRDPRRLVGFFGFTGSSEDGNILSHLEHVAPGTGSYAFVSNRAVFVHKLYMDHLPAGDLRVDCCDVSLSLQVSLAFEETPVVVKAKVMDLLEKLEGVRGQEVGVCDLQCFPSWLQVDHVDTILHEHTAVLGEISALQR